MESNYEHLPFSVSPVEESPQQCLLSYPMCVFPIPSSVSSPSLLILSSCFNSYTVRSTKSTRCSRIVTREKLERSNLRLLVLSTILSSQPSLLYGNKPNPSNLSSQLMQPFLQYPGEFPFHPSSALSIIEILCFNENECDNLARALRTHCPQLLNV